MKGNRLLLLVTVFVVLAGAGCDSKNGTTNTQTDFVTAPTNLRADWVNTGEILLRWRDRSDDENGFEVFESLDSSRNYNLVAVTTANVDSVLLAGRNPEVLYFYKVRAFRGTIYSGYSNETRVASGMLIKTLCRLEAAITAIDFSPAGVALVTGSSEFLVRTWDVGSGQITHILSGHSAPINWVSYSPSITHYRIASQAGGYIKIWDVSNNHELYSLNGDRPTFFGDGVYFVYKLGNNTALIETQNGDLKKLYPGYFIGVTIDGSSLATFRDSLATLMLWDLRDTSSSPRVTEVQHIGDRGDILSFSPLGNYLAMRGNGMKIIRLEDNTEQSQLEQSNFEVYATAFRRNETYFAASALREPWHICVWNVQTGELVFTLSGHNYVPYQLCWSPDDNTLASASGDGTVKLWGPFR